MAKCASCNKKMTNKIYLSGACECQHCGKRNIENPFHKVIWAVIFLFVGFLSGALGMSIYTISFIIAVLTLPYFFTKKFKISDEEG